MIGLAPKERIRREVVEIEKRKKNQNQLKRIKLSFFQKLRKRTQKWKSSEFWRRN